MRLPRWQRYGPASRWYDLLSLEWPVYRAGRVAGIAALELQPGERVLDVACGTGLNFPLLRTAVGDGGSVVAVDSSATMLGVAQRRSERAGWRNVTTVRGDAASLDELGLGDTGLGRSDFDAVMFSYALSVIDGWHEALAAATRLVRPGGRVLVVDLALPRGRWRWLSPLARLACFAGGSDPHRHPWDALPGQLTRVTLRGGHIQVVVAAVG